MFSLQLTHSKSALECPNIDCVLWIFEYVRVVPPAEDSNSNYFKYKGLLEFSTIRISEFFEYIFEYELSLNLYFIKLFGWPHRIEHPYHKLPPGTQSWSARLTATAREEQPTTAMAVHCFRFAFGPFSIHLTELSSIQEQNTVTLMFLLLRSFWLSAAVFWLSCCPFALVSTHVRSCVLLRTFCVLLYRHFSLLSHNRDLLLLRLFRHFVWEFHPY